MQEECLSTERKALQINLDKTKYGTFAEIGAGQEVVRWFFRAGAAAATIAKSISAYDMTVSDAIYGVVKRYVSRERLQTMLDYEYRLECERLQEKRGDTTQFFVFADTVRARSYYGSSECHGWMGIKFQTEPRADASQILIHVRMLDKECVLQQEALGIIGVNLVHAAFYLYHDPDRLLEALLDNLTAERVEVDMIKFSGPQFERVDHRLLSLKLVQKGLTDAAMFGPDGEILQPSEALYKKAILVERGSFRPVTHLHVDMLDCARTQFLREPKVEGEEVLVLMELTMRNLLESGELDYRDFLARAELLATTGATVLISDYAEYYRLASFLSRYTDKMIGLAMGVPSLQDLFEEKYYENLDGGVLEAFGRLFKTALKLYVYPTIDPATGEFLSVQKLKVAPHLRHLYQHLVENNFVESIDLFNRDWLRIASRDVLAQIRSGDSAWERHVPDVVADRIKKRKLLGYRPASVEKPESGTKPEEKVPAAV
jgi:hypothetical protein